MRRRSSISRRPRGCPARVPRRRASRRSSAGKAGYVETSIAMWEDLARTSDNKYIRELAERYIEKLKAGTFPGAGAR